MNKQKVAQELVTVARELTAGSYEDAVAQMDKAFRSFGREYMKALDGMIMSRGEDDALNSREMKKQRDAIVEGFSELQSAIGDHMRSVKRL